MKSGVEALNERLGKVHEQVREYFPFVMRVAVALYDPKTDDIKTFLHSTIGRAHVSRALPHQARERGVAGRAAPDAALARD